MAGTTQINKNLHSTGNATIINRQLAGNNASETNNIAVNEHGAKNNVTVVNPHINAVERIQLGTVLFNKYTVQKKLDIVTGEADLYLCVCDEAKYIAKIYRRTDSIKKEVLKKLQKIDSPFIAKIYDYGEIGNFSVEIMPFYSRGSLSGKKFTVEELKRYIIPGINEGLKALHQIGIIHKDLKPANIMIGDDQKTVSIIDFGISSVMDGNTIVVTRTGMTPEYSAPETFRNVYHQLSDYYSMGITIYELFVGHTPYNNISTAELERYLEVQRVPFPRDMPGELKDLIKALTYRNITDRDNRNNPNCRWGYEQVRKWLIGQKQVIPGEGTDLNNIPPYIFLNKQYKDRTSLIRAMVNSWDNGKKELFRGKLADYYRKCDQDAAEICHAAEVEATRTSGKDDLIFWRTMYALEPETSNFYWKGKMFAGLAVLGRELLDGLRSGYMDMENYMDSVFHNEILSQFIKLKDPKNVKTLDAVLGLESQYRAFEDDSHERKVVFYLTGYMLSGQKIFYFHNQEFHTLDELVNYMKSLLGENNNDLEKFKEFCHGLMDNYDRLLPAFESWLIASGKKEALDKWKNAITKSA